MKLLGSAKNEITKDKMGKIASEITEVVVSNDYQHYSRALNTFVPNKSFGQL